MSLCDECEELKRENTRLRKEIAEHQDKETRIRRILQVSVIKDQKEDDTEKENNDADFQMFCDRTENTSTPRKKAILESSFDRLPRASSPKYPYYEPTPKSRAKRKQIPGRYCDDCLEFYKMMGYSENDPKFQKLLDSCSKHRAKYQRHSPPAGFWNPGCPEDK